MSQDHLKEAYNRRYGCEDWRPLSLYPNAVSPTRYDDIARLLRVERGSYLEIGCGSGGLTIALASQFDRLVGLDLADVRIELARQVLAECYPGLTSKVEFRSHNAGDQLPFADASFDVVCACAVLEHCVDIFRVMDEIARVCRPGGCLVLTVPNICYIKHVVNLLLGKVPVTSGASREISYFRENGWDGNHLHYFSKASLRGLLRNVGFVDEAWTGDGRWARIRRWYCNFVGNLTVRARRQNGLMVSMRS